MEEKVGQNLDDFMLQFQKTPLEESRHGKPMTLGDYKIKNGTTLFLLKVGITLNITNPQVHLNNIIMRSDYLDYRCMSLLFIG